MADVITLDGLELPGDLVFADEYEWCEVERKTEYSLTGALIVQESTKLAGRPITLSARQEALHKKRLINETGGYGHIWISRSTLDDLISKANTPALEMTLVLPDDQTFTVMFREEGISAQPLYHIMPHEDADPYYVVIKLITV